MRTIAQARCPRLNPCSSHFQRDPRFSIELTPILLAPPATRLSVRERAMTMYIVIFDDTRPIREDGTLLSAAYSKRAWLPRVAPAILQPWRSRLALSGEDLPQAQ